MTDIIGRIFDRKYRITQLIGEGGMGSVYEAEHTLIQRKVAVKVLHNEFTTMPEVVERFFREAQATSAIGHPNIIEVFHVGIEDDGTVYIVMELLEGHSLLSKLKNGERLSAQNAVAIILQVLSALVAAHNKGIIHRDLKPDNIFLSTDPRGRLEVKLLDFGIAKVQGALDGDQGLTKTGTVLGTPHYMSPEQARGKEIDHRIDIWAAGVMLYQMLSGKLPYSGESYNEVMSSILLDDPPPLQKIAPDAPSSLIPIVEKAMAKDREHRYLTVGEMIETLIPFNEGAADLMSEPAKSALKSSLMPPPPVDQQDTLLVGSQSHSPFPKSNLTPSLSGLDLNSPASTSRAMPPAAAKSSSSGRGLKTTLVVILLLVLAAVGAIFVNQEKDQSFKESALALYHQATALWQGTVEELPPAPQLSDFTAGLEKTADASTEQKPTAHHKTPPQEMKDAGAPKEEEVKPAKPPKRVTIKLKGAPRRSKTTINGKRVSSPVKLRGSRKPVTLKVTAKKYKTYEQKIIPDHDQTIELRLEKKGRGKKSRKSSQKSKRSRR